MGNSMGKDKLEESEEEGYSIGYRFCPTDEELILHFLKRKLSGLSLPNDVVKDIDFYSFYPWDLHSQHRILKRVKETYFFTRQHSNYAFAGGFWHQVGDAVDIKNAFCGIIGFQRTLVFIKGISSQFEKTDWVLHEYRIMGNETWVLCKLFDTSTEGDQEMQMLLEINNLIKGFQGSINIRYNVPEHCVCSSRFYPRSISTKTGLACIL